MRPGGWLRGRGRHRCGPVAMLVLAGALATGCGLLATVDTREDPAVPTSEERSDFAVTAAYRPAGDASCGWRARLPDTVPPSLAPPTDDAAELFQWVIAHGGAPISPVGVRLAVHPSGDREARVVGLAATVTQRLPPLTGPEVRLRDCAPRDVAASLQLDLDEAFAIAREPPPSALPKPRHGRPFFSHHSMRVTTAGPLQLTATAVTASDLVVWAPTVRLLVDDREVELEPTGAALRTASADGRPSQVWTLDPHADEYAWTDADGYCARPGGAAWRDTCASPVVGGRARHP